MTKIKWIAEDYTGNRGEGRLMHPGLADEQFEDFLVLFCLMHAGVALHEHASMIAPRFIVGAATLKKMGWPIEILNSPLRVEWCAEVPTEVREAWRKNFGDRGMFEVKKMLTPISQFRRIDKPVMYTH